MRSGRLLVENKCIKKLKKFKLPGNSSREWLEVGEVCFGPLISQINVATDEYQLSSFQEEFLKFHDRKTRRLDFLWEVSEKSYACGFETRSYSLQVHVYFVLYKICYP